jgi:hypothetical protein
MHLFHRRLLQRMMKWSLGRLFDKYGQRLKEYFASLLGYQEGPDILGGKIEFRLWIGYSQGLLGLLLPGVLDLSSEKWSLQNIKPHLSMQERQGLYVAGSFSKGNPLV